MYVFRYYTTDEVLRENDPELHNLVHVNLISRNSIMGWRLIYKVDNDRIRFIKDYTSTNFSYTLNEFQPFEKEPTNE